jgi:dTDP-4-amino-4,6-dideoxygalactose transaminase
MILCGRQEITERSVDSILDFLILNFLVQVPKVLLFERELTDKVGPKDGVAANSLAIGLNTPYLS